MMAMRNLCQQFSVPWDFIGKELMDYHIQEKHPDEWQKIQHERWAT